MDILQEVKDYDIITIFRHQIADQDALGSQFGLKTFLETNYPSKKVYAIGNSVGSMACLFPPIDEVDDKTIASSIAFVLDTADSARIDDQRFHLAQRTVKIDHHIVVEEYAEKAYVDTSAAATCEILASLFQKHNGIVTAQCATYLYYGLVADSIQFTTTNTSSHTLLAASFLLDCGVDISEVKQKTSGMSLNEFLYIREITNHLQYNGNVVYAIMREEDYKKFNLTYNQAKEKVFALANIKEFEIWCLFSEDKSYGENLFNGSLRSKRIAINAIANKYQGGGHKNACGVKKLSLNDIDSLIADFNKLCE